MIIGLDIEYLPDKVVTDVKLCDGRGSAIGERLLEIFRAIERLEVALSNHKFF